MDDLRGVLLVIVASVVWSTNGTASALAPDVPGSAIGVFSLSVGGLILLVMFAGRVGRLLRMPGALVWACVGGAAVLVYAFAFYDGLRSAGVALGTVLNIGSAPVFAMLLEVLFERHRPRMAWFLGAFVGLVGLVALAATTHSAPVGGSRVGWGIALSLLSGALYALYTYAARQLIVIGGDALGSMASVFGIGGVLLVPALIVTGTQVVRSPVALAAGLYLAVLSVAGAFAIFGIALRTVPVSVATSVTLIEPMGAAVLASIVLGERITPIGWAGVCAVVVGLAISAGLIPRRTGFRRFRGNVQ